MDAKRWSPLWVFGGGCLTGAVLLQWHAHGGSELANSPLRADDSTALAAQSAKASALEPHDQNNPTPRDLPGREQTEAPTGEKTALTVASPDAAPEKADAGNSVADVLARLETEYRGRSTPAPAPTPPPNAEPAHPPSNEPPRELSQPQPQPEAQPSASDASAPQTTPRESPPVLLAAAAAPEAPTAAPRGPTFSVSLDLKPPESASEDEAAARLASLRDEQAKALDSGQKQLAQMQQLAALQQATLAQQYTLYQLQLLSLSPVSAPRAPLPAAPSPRRAQAHGGRIVAARPSTISDTDNPWGFEMQRSVLVR